MKENCRKCVHFVPVPFSTRGRCTEPFDKLSLIHNQNVKGYPEDYDPENVLNYCNNFLEK